MKNKHYLLIILGLLLISGIVVIVLHKKATAVAANSDVANSDVANSDVANQYISAVSKVNNLTNIADKSYVNPVPGINTNPVKPIATNASQDPNRAFSFAGGNGAAQWGKEALAVLPIALAFA